MHVEQNHLNSKSASLLIVTWYHIFPDMAGQQEQQKQQHPYTNTNKEKIGSFFSRALAYEVNGFPR